MPEYSQIETSALLALAGLILQRAKLGSIPVTNREQALRVIQGVRPALPRKAPLNIKPCTVRPVALCFVCRKELPKGSLCDALGRSHIQCQGGSNEV